MKWLLENAAMLEAIGRFGIRAGGGVDQGDGRGNGAERRGGVCDQGFDMLAGADEVGYVARIHFSGAMTRPGENRTHESADKRVFDDDYQAGIQL